ncbi:hypothetical protein Mgra_00009078 [Meloidogyne graminicola]|uniref:Uncharacterized protein n=1 Tax=Meloidogyne graminicola TaxID=189291 RepID=A0A8S9ZDZ7_9BILA|nr:hypothetical protein Mgra_00009078 [Meloidogyne graminicola]
MQQQRNILENKNDNNVNNEICRKFGCQLDKPINSGNNYFNFPSTVSSKWKPRLTISVLEQLMTTQNSINNYTAWSQQENNSPRGSQQPATPSFLRSQSVASRCQASPDILRDLSLRNKYPIFT